MASILDLKVGTLIVDHLGRAGRVTGFDQGEVLCDFGDVGVARCWPARLKIVSNGGPDETEAVLETLKKMIKEVREAVERLG